MRTYAQVGQCKYFWAPNNCFLHFFPAQIERGGIIVLEQYLIARMQLSSAFRVHPALIINVCVCKPSNQLCNLFNGSHPSSQLPLRLLLCGIMHMKGWFCYWEASNRRWMQSNWHPRSEVEMPFHMFPGLYLKQDEKANNIWYRVRMKGWWPDTSWEEFAEDL